MSLQQQQQQQQQQPLPNPPISTLPTLKRLVSLLEASATTSTSNETRSFEIANATSSLRQQLTDAEKYASGLPGGLVKEEQIEEIVAVLEGRVQEGRRTLASVANLPNPTSTLLLLQPKTISSSVAPQTNGEDVSMSS